MYTTHGHQVEGKLVTPKNRPNKVVRCGGPGLCTQCSKEAAAIQNKKKD